MSKPYTEKVGLKHFQKKKYELDYMTSLHDLYYVNNFFLREPFFLSCNEKKNLSYNTLTALVRH